MASSDNPEIVERDVKDKEDKKDGEKGEFIEKVKVFIHEIGEKNEETTGFCKPTVDVTGIHISKINHEKADIVVYVEIKNRNSVPILLFDIDYVIEIVGGEEISGLIPDAGTIDAHGSETVKIPLTLKYDDIKSTYDDIKPGSVIPYKIKVDLIVDVPVFGRLTLPLEKNGEIPIPYEPVIGFKGFHLERLSLEETVGRVRLKIENKNDFDLGLNAILDKNGITYVDIPITFKPKEFGSALWDMIRGKGTGYTMKGNINVDTPMKLPISKEGGTTP